MKAGKKLLFMVAMVLMFAACMGRDVLAEETGEIIPTYVKSGETTEHAATYQYQLNAGTGILSVPVQISSSGKVCIEVTKDAADIEMGASLSKSAVARDSNSWLSVGILDTNKSWELSANAEGACTWYLHIIKDADKLEQNAAVTVKAYQKELVTVSAKNVKLSKTSVTWNGSEQKPAVVAKDCNGNTISSLYYTVEYSRNENVGQAVVTVKFTGDYRGTVKKTFTIVPKGTKLTTVIPQTGGFIAQWKKQPARTTGYEIQYSASSKFKGKDTKIVNVKKNKTTSKSISKLKTNKKYYVRIRTYKTAKVDGKSKKLCSKWSKMKKVITNR